MNFGNALQALKDGERVAREGWNGKGMFLFLVEGHIASDHPALVDGGDHADHAGTVDGLPLDLFILSSAGTGTLLPFIGMRTATGSVLNGWLASQTDILAEDWIVVGAEND